MLNKLPSLISEFKKNKACLQAQWITGINAMSLGTGLFLGLSSYFSARMNLTNGREQRVLQEKLHEVDRTDAQGRFDRDINLRERQFLWGQKQAEAAMVERRKERMEDFQRQDRRDMEGRTFDRLRNVFNLPPDAWRHDPNASLNSDVKSLRVLLLTPKGAPEEFQGTIEDGINAAVKKYHQSGPGHPMQFPTRAWIGNAPPGSWISLTFHSLDQETPTLILRLDKRNNNTFSIHADMFGFPMGDRIYQDNIALGELPNDSAQIIQVLSLVTLASADMHFLSTYGQMPLLPSIFSDFVTQGDQAGEMVAELVTAYRNTINTLLAEMPETGVPASLLLAEALGAFPDKRHAIDQLRQIEEITTDILPSQPELQKKLSDFYIKFGAAEEAARLSQSIGERTRISSADARKLLENYR